MIDLSFLRHSSRWIQRGYLLTDLNSKTKHISIMKWIFFLFFIYGIVEKSQATEYKLFGSAHQFSFMSITGGKIILKKYSGKVILITNTASLCGYTRQYSALQKLWETYKDKGLQVIAVPSNDFGNQEPGTKKEIKQFCELNYGINFPIMDKVNITRSPQHPFYRWVFLQKNKYSFPKWNFHKYLIDGDGKLVAAFSSNVSPLSKKLIAKVETLLSIHQP